MLFSIIIPCYNEGDNLKKLMKYINILIRDIRDIEVLLVENGSKDSSSDILKSYLSKKMSNIEIIFVPENKGYGYGIQQALKKARGEYIGWIHADMQLPIKELKKVLYYLKENQEEDIFFKGIRQNRPFQERIFTFGMSFYETILFRKRLYDIGAIPVIFSRNLLKFMTNIPNDFSIELYTYYIAKKNKFKIIRQKVCIKNREYGRSSWNTGIKSKIKQSHRIIKDSLIIKLGGKVL